MEFPSIAELEKDFDTFDKEHYMLSDIISLYVKRGMNTGDASDLENYLIRTENAFWCCSNCELRPSHEFIFFVGVWGKVSGILGYSN